MIGGWGSLLGRLGSSAFIAAAGRVGSGILESYPAKSESDSCLVFVVAF